MTVTQRLSKFLIGVSIGLVFIAFVFGKKAFSCSYFPNSRVLEEAKFKNVKLSTEASSFFIKEDLDSNFLKHQLFRKSEINFNESKVNQKPCREYSASYHSEDKNYLFLFNICDETAELKNIKKID